MDDSKDEENCQEIEQQQVFDPLEAARTLGMTAKQKRYADNLLLGMTQTKAAVAAGYSPKHASATASKANTERVKAYLAWARAGGHGVPDTAASDDELRRILSRHARGHDKAVSVKATEALIRVNRLIRETEAGRTQAFNPKAVLDRMCELGQFGIIAALGNAKHFGMTDWTPPPSAAANLVAKMAELLDLRMKSVGLTEVLDAFKDAAPPEQRDYDESWFT